ncbi:DUF1524 domain-containing protein, partial [Listeria monocytogenes]|nr:DUF1524 domain-containing protein [Listeria monocytogenes]
INENDKSPETLSIGNLICLEESLNNKADNLDYAKKVEIYRDSKYEEVKGFIQKYPEFNIKKSQKRSKDLARFYYDKIINN